MGGVEVRVSDFDGLHPVTAYRIWQLREAVFVVEQQCPYPELDGRDLEPTTRHLWVGGAEPVAYLRILDEGPDLPGGVRIGRVAVARTHRGRDLADALMRRALAEVADRPCRLDAQSYLEGWYAGFGFTRSGAEFVEDGIPHVPMARG